MSSNDQWWRDSFTAPKGVDHDMGGEKTFYPVSVGSLVKLKTMGGPLFTALSTLFSSKESDVQKVIREFDPVAATEAEPASGGGREQLISAIDPELARERHTQRAEAIESAVKTLCDDKNIGAVGDLLIDSLRDLFPPDSSKKPKGVEFAKALDVVTMRQGIVGLFKANKEVFGPLAQTAETMLSKVAAKVAEGDVAAAVEETETETPGTP